MQTTDKMKTKSRVILAAAFTAVSLFSFVAGSIVISAINTNKDLPAAQAQVNQTDALTTYSIFDPTFKLVAGTYSHPAGWQADSQVKWDIEAFSQPLQLHSIAQSPDGLSALEFFPTEQFCWLVPNPGFKHPGLPMGDGATLLPPVSAVDAMVHFVIPKLRGNVANLQILQVVPMPQLSQTLGLTPAPGSTEEGVVAKLSYQLNGEPVEEEIYGVKVAFPGGVTSFGGAGRITQYNWGFRTLFSFRTKSGGMDAVRPAFVAMVQSFRPNPAWQACRAQFQQRALQHNNFRLQLTQQSIDNANMLSRTVLAANEQFFQHQAERRQYQAVSDQLRIDARHNDGSAGTQASFGGFSRTDAVNDLLGGQETYQDGSVHSGYHSNMWSDGQGNYIPSNDPNFNPNINSSSTWTQIQKKQLGQ